MSLSVSRAEALRALTARIDAVDAWLRDGGNDDVAILLRDLEAALAAPVVSQEENRLRAELAAITISMHREAAGRVRVHTALASAIGGEAASHINDDPPATPPPEAPR